MTLGEPGTVKGDGMTRVELPEPEESLKLKAARHDGDKERNAIK
jgi:hypothetical protein